METGDKLIQVRSVKKYYNHGAIKALDDVTVEQLAEALGVRVKILPVAGAENLRAILEG